MSEDPPQRVRRIARSFTDHRSDIRVIDDVDPERLRLLAAIGIEFNSSEAMIDEMLEWLLALDTEHAHDVASSISGIESKVDVLKSACRVSWIIRGDPETAIVTVLGNFLALKRYRDALAHIRIGNDSKDVVFTYIKHGHLYEADISLVTLRAVYEHVHHLKLEMTSALYLSQFHLHFLEIDRGGIDPNTVRIEPLFQAASALLRDHLRQRKKLPEIPRFPKEPPDQQGSEGPS